MQIEEHTLPGEGFGASLVSREDCGFVVVSVGIFLLARWGKDDASARDVFVVSGHLNGIKGKTLARLAFCGEAQVSRTLARYELGGAATLLRRGKPGRKPKVTPGLRKSAEKLRSEGHNMQTIAEKIGVGVSTMPTHLRGSLLFCLSSFRQRDATARRGSRLRERAGPALLVDDGGQLFAAS